MSPKTIAFCPMASRGWKVWWKFNPKRNVAHGSPYSLFPVLVTCLFLDVANVDMGFIIEAMACVNTVSYHRCFVIPGSEVPFDWKGGLDITYRLGPNFAHKDVKIELVINNKLEVKSIYNVIGTIYGREEPDRYVLIGNHRDSWVFGAVDASSGTTTITEVARGLGELLKGGWRPRRTIKVSATSLSSTSLLHRWAHSGGGEGGGGCLGVLVPGNLTLFQTKGTQFCYPVPEQMVKIDTLLGFLCFHLNVSMAPIVFSARFTKMPLSNQFTRCFFMLLVFLDEVFVIFFIPDLQLGSRRIWPYWVHGMGGAARRDPERARCGLPQFWHLGWWKFRDDFSFFSLTERWHLASHQNGGGPEQARLPGINLRHHAWTKPIPEQDWPGETEYWNSGLWERLCIVLSVHWGAIRGL